MKQQNHSNIIKKPPYKLRGVRVALVIFFSILIFGISAGAIVFVRFAEGVYSHQTNMNENLKNVRYSYKNEQIRKNAQESFDRNTYKNQAYLISGLLDEIGDEFGKLEEISGSLSNGCIYVENSDHIFESFENENLNLTDKQKNELQKKGNITIRNSTYFYMKKNPLNVILRFDNQDSLEERNLFAFAGEFETLLIVNREKDRILRTNRNEMKGKSYSSYLGEKLKGDLFYRAWENNESCEHDSGLSYSGNGLLLYEELIPENIDDNVIFSIQIPLMQIFREIIRNTFPQLLMMFLVFVLLTAYTIRLFWTRTPLYYNAKKQKIYKKWHIDRGYASHISGFLVFGMIASIFVSFYLQVLFDYSTQNLQAEYNLKEAAELIETTKNDEAAIKTHYMDSYVNGLVLLSDMISIEDDMLEQEKLYNLAKIMGAEDISVFDDTGLSVASSSGYTGYVLSGNEDSPDLNCWSLLTDGIDKLTWEDQSTGKYYAAVRRKDKTGLIRCISNGESLKGLVENLTLEEVIACANFNEADKIYVDLSEPKKAYLIEADGFTQKLLKDPLQDELMTGNYTGRKTINGNVYYINELKTENVLLISAAREGERWMKLLAGIVLEIAGYILFWLMLLFLTAIHRTNTEDDQEESTTMNQKGDNGFMRMLNLLLLLIAILLVALIVVEMKFYSNSVLKYLFSNKWDKTFNLFSITMILIFVVSTKIIIVILQKIILLIAGNTGPRGITIGHMLCSLIKFGTLIAAFIFAFVELGAKLSYLLTGAGLIGVVIGYACQGVLNDLLSGLFIVFEGHFQVGDWISVDDWRGEVKAIGVRTTTIAKGGDVRVFNNSCLSKITVWSPSMSGALCLINVAYEENLDRVIRVIEQSGERYRTVCPHIVKGPGVHGVTELGTNGITVRIWASVDQEDYVGETERLILKETKKIFDENGITIPFPQVVVHNPGLRVVKEETMEHAKEENNTPDVKLTTKEENNTSDAKITTKEESEQQEIS